MSRKWSVDLEIRPRAEFRDNFMLVPADSIMRELYVSQRNRINISYTGPKLKFQFSPQEVHIWAKAGTFSRVASINAFELYIEPSITKNLSVRIGRQALALDNGRLFSAANWSQHSRSHEGVRIFYTKKFSTDLTIAFTRPYGKHFDVAYSPVASHQYKFLFVHHLKYKLNNRMDLTTINAVDMFEKTKGSHDYYTRITNGGRLEYNQQWLYTTLSGFYQYGSNAAGKKISAYYIQPEISTKGQKTTLRLGVEVMSGNKNILTNATNSFVPLYGVAWKFMGNMNLFTKFPADVNDKGLVNPYLFVIYQVNKKLSLRADSHLFYLQQGLSTSDRHEKGTYLGFENDFSLNIKPIKQLEIIGGISYTIANERMEALKKVPDASKIPVWSYLMVSFTPNLLRIEH